MSAPAVAVATDLEAAAGPPGELDVCVARLTALQHVLAAVEALLRVGELHSALALVESARDKRARLE